MTTNQPLSLFISSKMAELADERRAVQTALAEYHMYGWLWEDDAGARAEPIRSTYLTEVAACDLYIGLFWLGYGPYTIEEFEHAQQHKKACLIYEKHVGVDQRDPQLQAFLARIGKVDNPHGLTICRFTTPEQLAAYVQRDVMHLLTTRFRESRQQPFTPTAPIMHWLQPARQVLSKTFVGRQDYLDTLVKELVADESIAIRGKTTTTTLQGMGGIGKTYLALKLAMELYDHFPGGVIRLDVGPQVTDEASVQVPLSRLASYAFGGIPPVGQLQPEQVAAWLEEMAPGRLLVILDDVWHPLPLRILNRALPADAVRLVTTRYANVAQAIGGRTVPVDRLTPQDGLALLEDRLNCQGDTTYRVDLEALVRLLDGHALALDIASARIKKPARVRAILHDLQQGIGRGELNSLKLPPSEERDENLEKTLAFSYERMTAAEQRRFRALGAFAAEAPITADAAAAIWGMDDVEAAQNALFDLTDLTLLTEVEETSGVSYRQHALLRVYAHALLDKADELTSASRIHAQYYTDMSQRAVTTTPKDYPLLDRNIQNLQAALLWTADNESLLFSRLLNAVDEFLLLRGYLVLLETYLPKAVIAASAIGNKVRQADLLMTLGAFECQIGKVDAALVHYNDALPLYRAEANRIGEANVFQRLGDLDHQLGNLDQARASYDAALPLYGAEANRLGEANVLKSLGDLERGLGNLDQARASYDAALPLYRQVRNRLGEANVLNGLGTLERRLGNLDQARASYDAALPLYRTEHDRLGEANVLQNLGDLESRLDNLDEARAHYDAALALYRVERSHLGEANLLVSLGKFESRLGNLDQARAHYDAALPLYRVEHHRLGEAQLLQNLGALEHKLGNLEQARAHYNAALPLYRQIRNRLGEANIYMSLGYTFLTQKEWTQARTYYEQALPLYIAERDPLGQAYTLFDLGQICCELGDYQQGLPTVGRAAELFHFAREELWAHRAEQYLAETQARLDWNNMGMGNNDHLDEKGK